MTRSLKVTQNHISGIVGYEILLLELEIKLHNHRIVGSKYNGMSGPT